MALLHARRGSRTPAARTRPIGDDIEAEMVLAQSFNKTEAESWRASKGQYVDFEGSNGGKFRVWLNGTIAEFTQRGPVHHCAHLPIGACSVKALNVLAVKLLLQTDEARFRRLHVEAYGDRYAHLARRDFPRFGEPPVQPRHATRERVTAADGRTAWVTHVYEGEHLVGREVVFDNPPDAPF